MKKTRKPGGGRKKLKPEYDADVYKRQVFARQATDAGKKVLVIDKRPNIAGTDLSLIHI